MTVIMGINLSDRLYIAADTRVSRKVNGVVVPQHDNILKVEHLKHGIIIACAGHAGLAKHIVTQLRRAPFISLGIDVVREKIEEWIGPKVDWYWNKQGNSESYATFIIGASTKKRKRVLSNEQLSKMQDAIFNDEEARKQTLGISGNLFNAMLNAQGGNELRLNSNDFVLFSITTSHQYGINIEDSQWGDLLFAGPKGMEKDDVSPVDIARLEFMENNRPDSDNGVMLITAYFYGIVEKKKLEGVGKAVVVDCIRSNETYLIGGAVYTIEERNDPNVPFVPIEISNIKVINDVVTRVENGNHFPLTPVSEYESSDASAALELL